MRTSFLDDFLFQLHLALESPANAAFFGNSPEMWLYAIASGMVTFALIRLFLTAGIRHLGRVAARTSTRIDDVLLALVSRTHPVACLAVAVYVGVRVLDLSERADRAVSRFLLVVLVVQCTIWAHHAFSVWIRHLGRVRAEDGEGMTTIHALGFLGKMLLWVVSFLLILDNLGVNISALVTGLGIGGIAVALAVQNVLGDLLASLSIVIDKPFVVGDFIIVDNLMGTVERIGLKSTRVRSLSGEQIVVPNNDLLKSRVRNYKRMSERRVVLVLGVTFDTDADKLAEIPSLIRSLIQTQENVRFDRTHFRDIGEYSLNFEAVFFILSPDYNQYMDIQEKVNLALIREFRARGIDFAFPTRRVELVSLSPQAS